MSVSVDTARFTPSPFTSGDTLRICFAGRLDAFKDPPLMLASLAEAARRLAAAPAGRFRRLAFDYVGASDIASVPGFAQVEAITTHHGPQPAANVAAIMRDAHAGLAHAIHIPGTPYHASALSSFGVDPEGPLRALI